MSRSPSKRRLHTRLAAASAACALAIALTPPVAGAVSTNYWAGYSGGTGLAGRHADVTRTNLTSSWVQNYNDACCELWAGAHVSGSNTLYANWMTGNGYACHDYGTPNIGAMFETPYVAQTAWGYAEWTGSPAGAHC